MVYMIFHVYQVQSLNIWVHVSSIDNKIMYQWNLITVTWVCTKCMYRKNNLKYTPWTIQQHGNNIFDVTCLWNTWLFYMYRRIFISLVNSKVYTSPTYQARVRWLWIDLCRNGEIIYTDTVHWKGRQSIFNHNTLYHVVSLVLTFADRPITVYTWISQLVLTCQTSYR